MTNDDFTDDPAEFDTSQSFDFREWLRLWSYEKSHAVLFGAIYALLAASLDSAYILAVGVGVFLWAIGVRASPFRSTRSGDKTVDDIPDVETHDELAEELAKRSRDDQSSGLVAEILVEIRHKPHYFVLGSVLGDRIGYYAHEYVYGVPPTHYEQLPEIIDTLVMFV